MAAIANSPGVNTYTTGAGIVKPVIRGLTSQRVLVVADGSRQEGQQWGDEHGPEIDAFEVKCIEVLRGPSSMLYGSDAIGGVVNVIHAELPAAEEGDPSCAGNLIVNGFSNNQGAAGALALYGVSGALGYRGHFSVRHAEDIETPDGKLFNSGLKELDGGVLVGTRGNWGIATIDYSHFGLEPQIHEDPAEDPRATGYQKIQHDKVHVHGDLPTHALRVEIDGSWQKNVRREFEEEQAVDPALHLRLNTYTLDLEAHHHAWGPLYGTAGVSLMAQKNETRAEEKLITGYDLLNLAAYLYEEAQLKKFNLSGGLRYDRREVDIAETPDLSVVAQTLNYEAVTGNVGVVYRVTKPFALTASLGRGWRAPTPFELFVDGVHEGTVQYLIGDSGLQNEESFNAEASARYATSWLQSELIFYQNKIGNYIYADPTGQADSVSGFQIYLLKQADAALKGVEWSLQAQATRWLVLTGGYSYLLGENDKLAKPLPLMPANRWRAGFKLTTDKIGSMLSLYFSAEVKDLADQNRVEDFEHATEGYTLVDAGAGVSLNLARKRRDIDLRAENLFDVAYRNHLSRYKDYALNPGRNVALKVSLPFTLVQ